MMQTARLLPRAVRHGVRSARSVYTVSKADTAGLVLGVNKGREEGTFTLTSQAESVNSLSGGALVERLSSLGRVLGGGEARYLGNLHPDLGHVIAVGVEQAEEAEDPEERIDQRRENIRVAAAAGVKLAADMKISAVKVDGLGDSEAAAEAAVLVNWTYQQFKKEKKSFPLLSLLSESPGEQDPWARGLTLGSSQNFARHLMEAPANFLTPSQFCAEVQTELAGLPVSAVVREESWAREKGMGSFLSVSRGSAEPPKFLELHYNGAEAESEPIVLVGKGVTFDTGGISLKPPAKMDAMRADMGGAATVTASLKAAAELGLKANIIALIPLTENMPGGKATKPGDVVTAMNGMTIQVDNTDAEGRLILADALCYADSLKPRLVMDVATLTGAISVALGSGAAGVYSKRTGDWETLSQCGARAGDRVWRMPLWKLYNEKMKKSALADLNNISLSPGAGSCTAAAFLSNFTACPAWLHLDIAGVMDNSAGDVKYLSNGMSGRPTRTIVHFLQQLSS